MPNTLTTIFTSTPASEPVESPHPNTGLYVLGTQLGNGTWQVVHTLVSKTSTPPTITGRLKNFPAVAASVVASGNVLNNILTTPTGLSAVASSASAINATVSSNPNATAYRLLSSATAGGTYAPIYQGAAAGFAHTGLTAGTTYYYEWQYVGGGYYDDSALSAVFSGITSAAAPGISFANADVASIPPAQSNGSGYSDTTQAAYTNAITQFPNNRVGIWNKGAGVVQVYQPGTNDQGIPAGTVQGYPRGFGPDLGFAISWLADSANTGRTLVFYKTDLTPPLSTNGSSIAAWNNTLKASDYADHANFVTYMQGKSWGNGVSLYSFPDLGEADSQTNNTNYQADFTALIADFQSHGFFDANTKFVIPLLQRLPANGPNDAMINNAKTAFVNARTNAVTMVISNPVFNPADNTHYNADSQLRRGAQWYLQRTAVAQAPPPTNTPPTFTTLQPAVDSYESNAFTFNYSGRVQRSAFATVKCAGPATQAVVTLRSDRQQYRAAGNSVTVFLDNVLLQHLECTQNATNQNFTLNYTPQNGGSVLKFVQGSVAQDSSTNENNLVGTVIQQIVFNQTMSIAPAQSGSGVPVVLAFTGGVGVGDFLASPETDSWVPKLRLLQPTWFVVSNGWSGRLASLAIGASYIAARVSQAVTVLGGASKPVLYWSLAVDDKVQGTLTPTQLATAMGAFFDQVQAQISALKVIIQTPTLASASEGANAAGYTLDNYRTAMAGVATGRAFVSVLDGKAIVSTTNQPDGTNVNAAGYTQMAAAINTAITNLYAAPAPTGYTLYASQAQVGFTASGGTWQADVPNANLYPNRGAGHDAAAYSTTVGAVLSRSVTGTRFGLLCPMYGGGGVIGMRVKNSGGTVLSDQTFSLDFGGGGNKISGYPDTNTPQISYSPATAGSYTVEAYVVSGTAIFTDLFVAN